MFHQFEPHLVSSDDKGNITVYDGEKNMRLNRFANGSPVNVPISTLRFVNEDDVALLMTASGAESSSLRSRNRSLVLSVDSVGTQPTAT